MGNVVFLFLWDPSRGDVNGQGQQPDPSARPYPDQSDRGSDLTLCVLCPLCPLSPVSSVPRVLCPSCPLSAVSSVPPCALSPVPSVPRLWAAPTRARKAELSSLSQKQPRAGQGAGRRAAGGRHGGHRGTVAARRRAGTGHQPGGAACPSVARGAAGSSRGAAPAPALSRSPVPGPCAPLPR